MKVKLIAATEVAVKAVADLGFEDLYEPIPADDPYDPIGDWDADFLAEFAGRNCYQSFDRPNPATRENEDYLAHILQVGHESVLAHASATFYIDTSRSVLAEITRSRFLAFSVVSQRYVDAENLGWHTPPAVNELLYREGRAHFDAKEILEDCWLHAQEAYEHLVEILEAKGFARKQAREAARAVLPNMASSPMVVTGNHRAWRDFIKQRWTEAADAEIRELAGELLRQLREIAPNTYQDIPNTPYPY